MLQNHCLVFNLFSKLHITQRYVAIILFEHENLAYCVRNILWRVRRKILAVVTLQQGFQTKLSVKKRVYNMLNFHVRGVFLVILKMQTLMN